MCWYWGLRLRSNVIFNSLRGELYQFSYSVVSNSLRPQGMQHTRLPCPSPTPGPYTNSCPLSRWCHPTISSSVGELYNVQINKIILDCNKCNEIKRCLLLGRKAKRNLDRVFKKDNGNPLQCSCLENPKDGGAWWAAIYGVAKSDTTEAT